MERHLDRPNHQVGGSGEWVVGCGWRNTWIGPTIRVGGWGQWVVGCGWRDSDRPA